MVKPDIVTATTSAKVEYKDTRVPAHSSITPIEIQHVCTNSSNKHELLRSLMVGQKTYLGTTNNRPEFSQAPGIRSQTSLFIKLCVCLSYSYISILVVLYSTSTYPLPPIIMPRSLRKENNFNKYHIY